MLMERYQKAVDSLFLKIRNTQTENIIKAGNMIAECVANGGNVYLSKICHEIENDLIYRGGGPIFYKHFSYNMHVEDNGRKRDRADLNIEPQSVAAAKYALSQANFRPGDVLVVS